MSKHPPKPLASWAYFLDVDGTLIELAQTPESIRIEPQLLELIHRLYQQCDGALALISGRSLHDLDQHLRLFHVPIAGQHGLERRDSFGHIHRHSISPFHCESIVGKLKILQRKHTGLKIETKGATLAVHYRLAPRLGPYLHRLLRQFSEETTGVELQPGKAVLELKPAGFDKGNAIQEFMMHAPFSGRMPVFLGDDLTDEHGFAMVNQMDGISIKVGSGRSKARYRLFDVAAVRAWLAGSIV